MFYENFVECIELDKSGGNSGHEVIGNRTSRYVVSKSTNIRLDKIRLRYGSNRKINAHNIMRK